MRRRPQADLVRREVDAPVEPVRGAVVKRYADGHVSRARAGAKRASLPNVTGPSVRDDAYESSRYAQSGSGSCANTRRKPSPHCVWIIWKYGSVSSMRRCMLDAQRVASRRRAGRSAARPRCSSASSSRTTPSMHLIASVSAGVAVDHAVDDRLAVLRLADLEVRRVGRRLDEVALGVDVEQALRLAAHLPAEDEVGATSRCCSASGTAPSRLFTSRSASPSIRATSNIDGALKKCISSSPARMRCSSIDERVLRDRQVAGRHRHDHPLAVLLPTRASWRSGRSGRRPRWCGNRTRRSSRRRATWQRNTSWPGP